MAKLGRPAVLRDPKPLHVRVDGETFRWYSCHWQRLGYDSKAEMVRDAIARFREENDQAG